MVFQQIYEKALYPPHRRMVNMGGTHIRADEVLVVGAVSGRKPLLSGETVYSFVVTFRGGPAYRHKLEYFSEDAATAAKQRLLDAVEWFASLNDAP